MNYSELIVGKWYIIYDSFISRKDIPAKYLGICYISGTSLSFELNIWTGYGHCGETKDTNSGRHNYCVFLSAPDIIRELSKTETIMEML